MNETIVESEALQTLFNESDTGAVLKHADHTIELDVCDCDDVVGEQNLGVEAGVRLYEFLINVRKIKGNENAKIYRIIFDDYSDDDGIAYFVGTEEGLTEVFKANPAG